MENGKQYELTRNYEHIKQIKESRDLEEKRETIKREKEEENEIKLQQEKLEQMRKMAKEKGCLLTQDYKGDFYSKQDVYNYPKNLSWDEYVQKKESILNEYMTLQDLIKAHSSDITTLQFNKSLKNLHFITKRPLLNQNNWILQNHGLKYGINLIKDSRYMHIKIPNWYKVHIFNHQKMELIELTCNTNIKMSSILFKKNKFTELLQIIKEEIENRDK